MGLYREVLYKRYGKYPDEALFYTHLLPLPFFFMLYNNIWEHSVIATNSIPYAVPFVGFEMPLQWFYLIANVLTQYLCISSVYVLNTECSLLTVKLVFEAYLLFSFPKKIVVVMNDGKRILDI